jgi:DNA-binding PucR family transcriptional regulator
VHDKTIRYRIRRIREVTRLCPLRDRGRLELALMLHRLGAVES